MVRGKTKYSADLAEERSDWVLLVGSSLFFIFVAVDTDRGPNESQIKFLAFTVRLFSIFSIILLFPAVKYYVWRREYSRWCAVLNDAKIRWVKVEALRRWQRNGERIPRMQDLVTGDYIDTAWGSWNMDRNRFVVSHAWLSKGDPDPTGEQLNAIVAELDRLTAPDSDVVFYDRASIPQSPGTEQEKRHFKVALQNMNLLYTLEGSRVLVIPQVSERAPNPTQYSKRGWCFFEIAISSAMCTIFNYESSVVMEVLESSKMPLASAEFRVAFARTEFTVKGDRKTVESLYDGFLSTREARRMASFIPVIICYVFSMVDARLT